MVEDKLMPVMKENFLRNAHDTTFSPTGLYNFASGSLLAFALLKILNDCP